MYQSQHESIQLPEFEEVSAPGDNPAAPISFDGLVGFYHVAAGDTAVLMLSPWGYEELCARKTYRFLGDALAAKGYPCLRFDYPATAHSPGIPAELDDETAWRKAALAALKNLKKMSNASRVVVLGQGIGATFAADLASSEDVAGLVLMAPVAQGRAWLREIAAWTAMTQPTFLVSSKDGPAGGTMAGGFVLSSATLAEVKSLNLFKTETADNCKVLIVQRPEHPGDRKLAEHLAAAGVSCDSVNFEDYADYVSDPTLAVVPMETVRRITDWVADSFPIVSSSAQNFDSSSRQLFSPQSGVEEQLVRFGPSEMFFGAYSCPAGKTPKTAVLFLNSGYDHSIGWARMSVAFARSLAANGYAAMRMDLAGIGESHYWPGQPRQVLYSDKQIDDVSAAIDWLTEEAGVENILLYGRCSGAYLALQAAAQEKRVAGAFVVNTRRFVWYPEEDVDTAIREPLQSLETYSRKVFDVKNVYKIVSGEINPVAAAKKVARALGKTLDKKLAPLLGPLSRHHRMATKLSRLFGGLKSRNIPIELVYSVNDPGMPELIKWFGSDLKGLNKYPNVRFRSVENADHNLTPLQARADAEKLLFQFASNWKS